MPAGACPQLGTVSILPAPPCRPHLAAVGQDVAIAYGYNNLERSTPAFASVGAEQPLNQLSDHLRAEAAMAGYTEILTWALCSRADSFSHMQLPDDPAGAVAVGNPATLEFEMCRTSLLPGGRCCPGTGPWLAGLIWPAVCAWTVTGLSGLHHLNSPTAHYQL